MTRNLASCAALLLLSVSLGVAQTPQVAAPAAPAAAAKQPEPSQLKADDHTLQDGTPVKLQLSRALSSADAKAGQEISFEVVDDIDIDGITVLHRGASAIGVVTEAETKKRMGRAGKLNFNIAYVPLADNEKAALRAVNNSKGDSHVAGMTSLMVSMPMVAAPFLLLMKGGDSSIPKGTEITAFIDGDMHLDLVKFGAAPQPAAQAAALPASLVIDSTPAGADIEMDGALVGKTPSTVTVAPGSHQISVKKRGFTDWTKTVTVTTGTVHVNAELAVENH
jgi:hypothetical protein